MFEENSSAAFVKVAVAGTEYTPVHAKVTAVDFKKGGVFATRALPRAKTKKDRDRLLRQVLPIFKIQAVNKPAWRRADVPFAVIADGHRRYVHFQDEESALTQQRWC